jgi:hypothetical protein
MRKLFLPDPSSSSPFFSKGSALTLYGLPFCILEGIRLYVIMRVWGRRKTEDGREGIDEEKELRKLLPGKFL